MSADNMVMVNKKTFKVYESCVEDENFFADENIIGQGSSLEKALEIAENYCQEHTVEYGIRFV